MSDQRKATDILVAIENKVNTLLQIMSSYDMNMKLVLDRTNKIHNYISRLEAEEAAMLKEHETVAIDDDKTVVQTSADHVMTVSETPVGPHRTSRVETYAPMQIPTSPPIQQVPVQRQTPAPQQQAPTPEKSGSPDRKVPVSQRITDSRGKDLFMATISILDSDKNLIDTVKTNATGKWQAHLKPGKYHIHIVKTDSATKSKIEAMQELNIPNSNSIVMLPTAIIKRDAQ
jgi:hypothetical protein